MTVNSKIYFNYGHAYTAPDNIYRYGFAPHPRMWSMILWRGNPALKPPKTVQYALGYEQVLFDKYLIHAEVYYKDVTDQLGVVYYQNVFSDNPSWRYYSWDNKVYEDIIGLEFRIYKRLGRFLTGWMQTEFSGQKTGEIGYATRFVEGDPQNVSEFSKFSYPDEYLWEWTPSVMVNLDLHTPNNWGPQILGHTILGGWRINSILKWRQGEKRTWNLTNSPFVHNNMQNADYFSSDFFFSKDVSMIGTTTTFYLDVRNVFAQKLLDWTILNGPEDNPKSDQYKYLKSIEEHGGRLGHYKEDYIVRPSERPGERLIYRAGGPIRVYLGLRFNFNR
jgi:hypothetical protein